MAATCARVCRYHDTPSGDLAPERVPEGLNLIGRKAMIEERRDALLNAKVVARE